MNRLKMACGAILLLACATGSAFAQGYQTSFDDLTGWLPGSTSPPVNWSNDGTPSSVPGGAARTGANSLNYNDGNGYDSPGLSNAGPVFSPYVPLTNLTNPTLSFWCNFQTQPGSENAAYGRDLRQITIAPGAPYPLITEPLGTAGYGSRVGPCSAMGTWHRHDLALDPAWGQIQVAFYFQTMDSLENNYAGWFIDDFAIGEPPPPVTPAPGPGPTPSPTPAPAASSSGGGDDKACGCGVVSGDGLLSLSLVLLLLLISSYSSE